jgi:hypothetical protein
MDTLNNRHIDDFQLCHFEHTGKSSNIIPIRHIFSDDNIRHAPMEIPENKTIYGKGEMQMVKVKTTINIKDIDKGKLIMQIGFIILITISVTYFFINFFNPNPTIETPQTEETTVNNPQLNFSNITSEKNDDDESWFQPLFTYMFFWIPIFIGISIVFKIIKWGSDDW